MSRLGVRLGVSGVPLLSACMMMGGMGQMAHPNPMSEVDHAERRQAPVPVRRVQASNGSLTIVLSVPAPSGGNAVVMDAELWTGGVHPDPTVGDIWLSIETPAATVDQLRMRRLDSPAAGTYQASYRFQAAGPYVVTAVGSVGTGVGVRTVSVTTEVRVGGGTHDQRSEWLMPAALVGGLGMVAVMALMMSSSTF